jgi:uncharacterized protein YjgD (DUF1641 family)
LETIQKPNDRNEIESILRDLEKQEQLNSLHYLVQKLPEFVNVVQAMEGQLSFMQSVLTDKKSLTHLAEECENRWESLHITKDHTEALLKVTQLLPRVVPLLEKLEETILFVQNVWQDNKSVDYLVNSVKGAIPIQRGKEIIKETNERFAVEKDTNINIFKMYKLLKDPIIQKGFRYVETMLDVVQAKK